ncbi:MAG: hypothetical protein CME84_11075 [Henriciella sp.]|nr:hypothetical protein [Henriciella sp.]MBF32728.1 hypothetical protein [Hyphomonadaceae bacterium]
MIRCGLMICLYAGFALSGVAQGEQVYDPRDHLPDQLSEVLDFEPFTKGGPSNKEHGWSARAICIFPETSFADSLDKQLAYLSCLRNTARAVQRAVGHEFMPMANDSSPGVFEPTDRLRGARVVQPSQVRSVSGFWSYRLHIEDGRWLLDTRGISTAPRYDEAGRILRNDCRTERELSSREIKLLVDAAPSAFADSMIGGSGLCLDGAPTFTEVSYVDHSGAGDPPTKSAIYIRECGVDDGVSRFSQTMITLGEQSVDLRTCIWAPDQPDTNSPSD